MPREEFTMNSDWDHWFATGKLSQEDTAQRITALQTGDLDLDLAVAATVSAQIASLVRYSAFGMSDASAIDCFMRSHLFAPHAPHVSFGRGVIIHPAHP